MMTSFIEIALFLVILYGLWWLYFVGYRDLVIDHTRQRLFVTRDRLFEAAERGEIAFDSKAYGMVRMTLNGMIRYAHHVRLSQMFVMARAERRFGALPDGDRFAKELSEVLDELPAAERKPVLIALEEMHTTIVKHMIYRCVLLAAPFWLLINTARWRKKLRHLIQSKAGRSRLYVLDAEAEDIGVNIAKAAC